MKTILSLLLVLAGFTASFAQERAIQKEDFEVLVKNAKAILDARPHRVTVTSSTNVNGKPQETDSSKTIVEVASKDKRRSVRELKSVKQNSKREFIRFGNKTYSRENDGQWKQSGVENSPSQGNLTTTSEETNYKSIGKELLSNQNANVYQRVRNRKMIDNSNNEQIISTETVKYWFDDNGALLKREMMRENRRGNNVFNIVATASFDYDQKIQVIAPQIAGRQNK